MTPATPSPELAAPQISHEPFVHPKFDELQKQVHTLIPTATWSDHYIPTPYTLATTRATKLLLHNHKTIEAALNHPDGFVPALGLVRRLQAVGDNSSSKNKAVARAHNAAEQILIRHADSILRTLKDNPDEEKLWATLNVVAEATNNPSGNVASLTDLLIDTVDLAAQHGVFHDADGPDYTIVTSPTYKLVNAVSVSGTPDQQKRLATVATKLLQDRNPAGISLLTDIHSSPTFNKEARDDLNNETVRQLLTEYGIDYNAAKEAWGISAGIYQPGYESANLRTMFAIEKERPGICAALHKDFHIINFARYPAAMLIAQYDHRDDRDMPYGIMLAAANDRSAALYESRPAFRSLHKQLVSNGAGVRIYEVASKHEIPRALIGAGRRYGDMHFRIFVGHGRPDHIGFGASPDPDAPVKPIEPDDVTDKSILTKYDIERTSLDGLANKYAVPGCENIFVSCLVGQEDGLAHTMSKKYPDAPITAATQPIKLNGFTVTKTDGRIHIEVTYGVGYPGTEKIKYLGGRAVERIVPSETNPKNV